ncbi:hypothetical protein BLNAU_2982 [Blattamonas nauphoetae]|uniref:Uncharacterized protein n=1 Tax=Blattamonas nauphoetae TaxID=2049346 RepID=A0ABQ9YE63_9EUKA|nr:hypothetical protein BLNAU_2982 [Blattamonas nauphoetae]
MALEVNPWSELGTDPEPMVQDETTNSVTLLESLVLLAQKTSELANCEKVPTDDGTGRFKITYPTFPSDMLYLLANSQQPIMNGIKRAVFAYMDETSQSATTMIVVYVEILVGGGVLVMFYISFVAFYFTAQMMKIRRLALMDLLEVPKPKLRSVIRRLIATNGDETMTGTMTHNVDESMDEKSEGEEDVDEEAASEDNASVATDRPLSIHHSIRLQTSTNVVTHPVTHNQPESVPNTCSQRDDGLTDAAINVANEFPVYGLSTLISQMPLYVWLIQNEYEVRDSSNKRTYNDLHPIPRYIGPARR